MRFVTRAGIALMAFACIVFFSGWQLASLALDEKQMTRMFEGHAQTPDVTPERYPDLAATITDYLSGKTDDMQLEIEQNGEVLPAFGQREMAHMKDVRGLVALGQNIRWALVFIMGLALALFLLRQRGILKIEVRDVELGYVAGALAFYGILLVLAAWALIDFDGLFTLMHELTFSNDLWLLNPQEDLLIQLMPESFFSGYSWLFLKRNAFFYAGTLLAALYFLTRKSAGTKTA
ncbi:MAG: DUF1461 domain-containing protein [Eubacteriales bacterium]|jgi:integral membrane protein (TIGR01906 family)|nr:DUF1461 domain-containing protein [Eubacteriales bacterium]MDD4105462.1 DUF1461 domain-containing protein [Eubacteriales bacterium]MDD4710702.1 DUF1461 domain-containing protein [Eubacteriales bacterium]NLO16410.1 DUF1461 domain-containing protein [Clostridiales bacterium]